MFGCYWDFFFSHSRKEQTFCWLRVISPICKMMASPICSTFNGNHILVEAVSCDVPQISIVRSLLSSHNSGLRLVTGGTATWLHRSNSTWTPKVGRWISYWKLCLWRFHISFQQVQHPLNKFNQFYPNSNISHSIFTTIHSMTSHEFPTFSAREMTLAFGGSMDSPVSNSPRDLSTSLGRESVKNSGFATWSSSFKPWRTMVSSWNGLLLWDSVVEKLHTELLNHFFPSIFCWIFWANTALWSAGQISPHLC